MNEFRLFAHGVEFDVDAYLASAPLTFDGVWRKGESGHDHPKSSGVYKVLGDGRPVPVFEQERIAVAYLSANREALKALARHPQVTTFVLGLQYHIVLAVDTAGFCVGPSAWLMWHCLDVGVSPTYYVTLDREREWAGDEGAGPGAEPDAAGGSFCGTPKHPAPAGRCAGATGGHGEGFAGVDAVPHGRP